MREAYQKLLQSALDADHGKAVICPDAAKADIAKRNLFLVRRQLRYEGVSTFDALQIKTSPSSRNILFIFKEGQVEEPDEETEL